MYIFLNIYLTLGYMEEAPYKLENDIINFKKMGLVGTLFNEIYSFLFSNSFFFPTSFFTFFYILLFLIFLKHFFDIGIHGRGTG